MPTVNSPLDRAAQAPSEVEDAAPTLFDLRNHGDRRTFDRLLADDPPRFMHDTIADQIIELIEVRDPARKTTRADRDPLVAEFLAGRPIESYGIWVHYGWSSRLVHVLPCDEYREVRTARNRYKITAAEQRELYMKRVGIVGLSVGNAAAITFALEGIGGVFKIADFDVLSLSNMNRLRSHTADIGLRKTTIAAREMYEIDPYLEVIRYGDGVGDGNLDDFLLGGSRLDLLVEECDDLYLKIAIRERCRDLGIPVVMDTSDRGLFDIERFDHEPTRPIMHGLIGDVCADGLRGLPTKDKVPLVLDIIGGHRISVRMAASLPEIDHSIGSWPQLASAVALGGAITADAGRRLLLGELTQSGRWYVDLEMLVQNGTGEFAHGAPPKTVDEIAPEAQRPRTIEPPPAVNGAITVDAIRWIVSHGVLAPSPHNLQPWAFVWRNGRLECRHDTTRDLPTLDFDRCATWATFGGVVENLAIAARALGFESAVRLAPCPINEDLMCDVSFEPASARRGDLLTAIPRRTTNRRRDVRRPIAAEVLNALADVTRGAGAHLQVLTDDAALAGIARLMGAADRISTMNETIHREVHHGLRWTRAEVERDRDGLDVSTLELTASDRAGMWLLSKWEIVEALKGVGGGAALEDLAKKSVDASSAVGLVTVAGIAHADYFRGGRALQRLWLEATRFGLALQPWTGLPYLFARVERGGGLGLTPLEVDELRRLRQRYKALFDIPDGHAEVLLFRLGYAGPPSAIALRRPVERVLTIA